MSSAAEQSRIRRERREKKILAQGSSRLEKIAGLQGGASAREALHPDPPEADISKLQTSESVPTSATAISPPPATAAAANARRRSSDHGSPGRNLFSVDGGDEDPFNMLRGGNDPFANMPEELRNDPMMKLLMSNPMFGEGMPSPGTSGGGGMSGTSGDSSSDDLNLLADRISKQLFGALAGNQTGEQQAAVTPDASAVWKWKFLRIMSVVTVMGYLWTQLDDYHFSRNIDITYGIPIFYTFVVFSLSLQALRLILDQGRPLPGSTIAMIGSFLPHPLGTILISFARYRMIFTDLLEDFSALVFGLGLMYWLKTR